MSNGAFPSAARPLLELRHVSVDYHAENGTVHALTDVSLTLERGHVLGLAGESGCGKSTLGYAVTRLLKPPAEIVGGEVLYVPRAARSQDVRPDNENYHEETKEAKSHEEMKRGAFPSFVNLRPLRSLRASSPLRESGVTPPSWQPIDVLQLTRRQLRTLRWKEIAIVFQSAMNALNPVLSVGAQIDDVLRTHNPAMGASARRLRAAELLRLVGISPDRLRSYPHELSGGMRQRAIIAIALALSPELIVMDEPTTALDVVVQREILLEIAALRSELDFSIIFITHDLSLLLEIADEIAIMYAGRVVEMASSRELRDQPRHPYSYGMLNSFPTIYGERRRMTGIPGSPPDLRDIPTGCAFHPRCPMAYAPCQTDLPLLRPATPQMPNGTWPVIRQQVACHLYDPGNYPRNSIARPAEPPTQAEFAARYEAAYAWALGEEATE